MSTPYYSGYYSTSQVTSQGWSVQGGNLGMSNTYSMNMSANASANSISGINSMGVVPQNATVSKVSNVMVALAQPQQVVNTINGNVVDSGIGYGTLDGVADAPVNSADDIMNNNIATQKYDRQTIAQGAITLSMYPNGVAGPGYGPTN